jgi:hypothetical protein
MIPIRCLRLSAPGEKPSVRPIDFEDFDKALKSVRPSVSPDSIRQYVDWDHEFGYSSTP